MAQSALLDLAHLDLYVEGDTALRDEILAIFEENAQRWLTALDPAADDRSWKIAAHTLKGAARGVGAWSVGEVCAEAETLIDDDAARARRQDARARIQRAVSATIEELRALRDRTAS